ncbi:hypothetical protein [Phenylobacterium montanum]|uniref:Uncharacterized protein n=1 Tax=Phenylobacterium montanum TaxID=2823693 RepID=A0A975IXX3_9CAUL|nr:hypothetical protein [Caulobacter sp. S6]QUD89866.1 hypothetical protein KCG34_08345 [Caulobacter sp. S6]
MSFIPVNAGGGWLRTFWLLVVVALVGSDLAISQPANSKSSPAPSLAETREACSYVAARGPAIAHELVVHGIFDVTNTKTKKVASIGRVDGMRGGEQVEYHDLNAPPGSPAATITPRSKWNGPADFGARWFRHRGRTYVLHFETESLRHATYLGYIASDNIEHVACDFTSTEQETLRPVRSEGSEICRAVAMGNVKSAEIDTIPPEKYEEVSDLSATHVVGYSTVDFRNTGRSAKLALLQSTPGGNVECIYNFYEPVKNGKPTLEGNEHDLLNTLQDSDSPKTCDENSVKWFRFGGKTYFQNRTNTSLNNPPSDVVRYVSGNNILDICLGQFRTKWHAGRKLDPE